MPAEDPKAVIRRWVEAWNAQDLGAAEELLVPEFVPELVEWCSMHCAWPGRRRSDSLAIRRTRVIPGRPVRNGVVRRPPRGWWATRPARLCCQALPAHWLPGPERRASSAPPEPDSP
jgi:hypothetical protein